MSEMKRRGSDFNDQEASAKKAKADENLSNPAATEASEIVTPASPQTDVTKPVNTETSTDNKDHDRTETPDKKSEESEPSKLTTDDDSGKIVPESAGAANANNDKVNDDESSAKTAPGETIAEADKETKADASKGEVEPKAETKPTKTVGGFGAFSSGSGFGGFSSFGKATSAFGSTNNNGDVKKATPWAVKEPESEGSTKDSSKEPEGSEKMPVNSVFLNGEKQKPTGSALLDKEQKVVTGEEEEETEYSQRVKIYAVKLKEDKGGWKERGTGALKVNVDAKGRRRLVMRADGVLRVALNLPLVKNMTVSKGFKSSLASDKFIRISGIEEGDAYQFAFKCASEEAAEDLFEEIEKALP